MLKEAEARMNSNGGAQTIQQRYPKGNPSLGLHGVRQGQRPPIETQNTLGGTNMEQGILQPGQQISQEQQQLNWKATQGQDNQNTDTRMSG